MHSGALAKRLIHQNLFFSSVKFCWAQSLACISTRGKRLTLVVPRLISIISVTFYFCLNHLNASKPEKYPHIFTQHHLPLLVYPFTYSATAKSESQHERQQTLDDTTSEDHRALDHRAVYTQPTNSSPQLSASNWPRPWQNHRALSFGT